MTKENIVVSAETQNLGMGSSHQGFVGRYKITSKGIEDLRTDRWCEGTQYTIHPFKSTSEQFFAKCLDCLISSAPADIFHQMQHIKCKAFYVPMVKAGNRLVCLHSQVPELSYDFFNQGTCLDNDIISLFGKAEIFNPNTIQVNKTEFLSIWLSLADVSYVANQMGQKFDMECNPQVVFVPIHYLSFNYQKKNYVIICYGDEVMSQFTYRELPTDDVLTGRELLYNKPWISISILFLLLLIVVSAVIVLCSKLWTTLSCFVLFKLVIFGVPIFIIYWIAWKIIRIFGAILNYTMLYVEQFCSKLWQRHAIKRNLDIKRQAFAEHFRSFNITFPEITSFQIDTTEIKTNFNLILNRISAIRLLDKIKKNK